MTTPCLGISTNENKLSALVTGSDYSTNQTHWSSMAYCGSIFPLPDKLSVTLTFEHFHTFKKSSLSYAPSINA